MRTAVDDRLRDEAGRFSLRFACDDCAHFDADQARCSLGFEATPRREALDAPHVVFCKTFEGS